MDWIIAFLLMAITIGTFYFIVYKRKESFGLASLAVLYYFICFTAVGMVFLNLDSIFSYLFFRDISSSSVFNRVFEVMKVIYFIGVPMPVISAYIKIKKMNIK